MFNVNFFEPFSTLFIFALCGFVFGFLLRKANVSRFDVIVKQLILRDFTVMKVIFTAIIVGSIGIYSMNSLGIVALDVSGSTMFASIGGGLIFGVGMAVLGYCPGTSIAALADGSKDIIYGILGMIFGAFVYAEAYPSISSTIKLASQEYKNTFVSKTGISAWVFIVGLAIFAIVFFRLVDKKLLKKEIS